MSLLFFDFAEQRFQEDLDFEQQCARWAEALRKAFPERNLVGCFLKMQDQVQATVLDPEGKSRPEWSHSLQQIPQLFQEGEKAIPADLGLNGQVLLTAEITFAHKSYGTLVVGTSAEAPQRTVLHQVLIGYARYLGLRYHTQETSAGDPASLLAQRNLADLGEAVQPLHHELNNLINTGNLQIEVLKLRLPANFHNDVAIIKKQILTFDSVLKNFRLYRDQHTRIETLKFDLNGVVRASVAEQLKHQPKARIEMELPEGQLPLQGAPIDMERLVRLLLVNALRVTPAGQPIRVKTWSEGKKIHLAVEDSGPLPEELKFLFDASKETRPAVNSLEMAVCRRLVQRGGGKITAESLEPIGVRILVEMPAAG